MQVSIVIRMARSCRNPLFINEWLTVATCPDDTTPDLMLTYHAQEKSA